MNAQCKEGMLHRDKTSKEETSVRLLDVHLDIQVSLASAQDSASSESSTAASYGSQ